MIDLTSRSRHELLLDSSGRVFAVKVSEPAEGGNGDLASRMKEALDVLAKEIRHKPEATGRGSWGIKSVSFGRTMGAGSKVSLNFLHWYISKHWLEGTP